MLDQKRLGLPILGSKTLTSCRCLRSIWTVFPAKLQDDVFFLQIPVVLWLETDMQKGANERDQSLGTPRSNPRKFFTLVAFSKVTNTQKKIQKRPWNSSPSSLAQNWLFATAESEVQDNQHGTVGGAIQIGLLHGSRSRILDHPGCGRDSPIAVRGFNLLLGVWEIYPIYTEWYMGILWQSM